MTAALSARHTINGDVEIAERRNGQPFALGEPSTSTRYLRRWVKGRPTDGSVLSAAEVVKLIEHSLPRYRVLRRQS